MFINHSKQSLIKSEKGIYLANPTKEVELEALSTLEQKGFDGVVYIGGIAEREWNEEAIKNSNAVVLWVSKPQSETPSFTRCVNFEELISTGKLLYGRPNDADRLKYIDWLYEFDMSEKPFASMEELIDTAIAKCDEDVSEKVSSPMERRRAIN